jgi:D-glycero-D-manno-heptose 1,7-bisphosphate phosphatase
VDHFAFGSQRNGVKTFVLLDRDGTINVERHYLSDAEDLELLPNAAEGIGRFAEMGLGVAVVTNQSGLARGYFDSATVDRIHARLRELLADGGAFLDGIYVCPHHPASGCRCRKPAIGLAEQVAAEFEADLSKCFVVGDKACDIELGQRIGATTILVRTGYGDRTRQQQGVDPDHFASDLLDAAEIIGRLIRSGDHPGLSSVQKRAAGRGQR